MVFMADFRCDPLRHLGRNGSFWQRRVCGFDSGAWGYSEFDMSPEEEGEYEGKIKRVASLPDLRS
jgi:hypothetical protein